MCVRRGLLIGEVYVQYMYGVCMCVRWECVVCMFSDSDGRGEEMRWKGEERRACVCVYVCELCVYMRVCACACVCVLLTLCVIIFTIYCSFMYTFVDIFTHLHTY
jgi:hypothetical protein